MMEILKKYAEAREDYNCELQLAPYDWDELNSKLSFTWMPYREFLFEHAIELANIINELRHNIFSLAVWESVIKNLTKEEKNLTLYEFINPIATLSLNMPYVIRSRFIYSVSHLSNQANQIEQKNWIDDFPIDKEVYFETADTYGKPWRAYKKLKLALEKISDSEYRDSTCDFRNKYNHRFSQAIELGHTGFVTRSENGNGKVSYGFGYTEALMLKKIIPLLEQQHGLCLKAFEKYQILVNHQVSKINEISKIALEK